MQRIEVQLEQRYPHWFRGRRAGMVRPLLRRLGQWSRLEDIETFLAENSHLRDFDFLSAAIAHLQLDYRVEDAERQRISPQGRLLVVANHPSGALDALALLDCIGGVRRDVRIVANDLLASIAPLSQLLLPVRILGGRPSEDSLAAIEQALRAEQCVVVFPAGEVSRLGPRGIRDSRWRQGFLRFARSTGAPVLPVRIEARNSALFYGVSALYKPAATALLAREMYARKQHPLRLRIGWPLSMAEADDPQAALRRVRDTLYAIGRRRAARPGGMEPLAAPIDPARLVPAIAATERLGDTSDGLQIRLLAAGQDMGRLQHPLLQELGRLREEAFRSVGEGTRRARDLDAFDSHYDHILLWDAGAARIAGAYRVARGAPTLARAGLSGFYTASLFRYADAAIPRLAAGMELGRSFVVSDYRGSRSLDGLWQGIGAYLRRHPQVRYLYGAVSISAALPAQARAEIVAYYQHFFGSDELLALSARPLRHCHAPVPPGFASLDATAAYAVLEANLAALGTAVPTLYRQYTQLCQPGGARFLAFGVDPAFNDAIDGLIEIDLQRLHPRKRKRWLRERDEVPA
jgi:putative hemolysin